MTDMTKIETLKNELYNMYWTATCEIGHECLVVLHTDKWAELDEKRNELSRWSAIIRNMDIDTFRLALHNNTYGIQNVLFNRQ
jgi:hypothetical protein